MWRLLIVNLGVFIVLRCLGVVFTLTGISFEPALIWLGVPADISRCLIMPWTFITYMFVHYDFFHILFNMLAFYWFAQLFLKVFTPKQMFALYIYGGLGATSVSGGSKSVFTANVPIGIGVKYKVRERLNVGLDWGFHLSLNDELDGVKDPYRVKSSGAFKNTDCYSTLQMTLTYSFMQKCVTCNKDY